jgi:hypothetical protein
MPDNKTSKPVADPQEMFQLLMTEIDELRRNAVTRDVHPDDDKFLTKNKWTRSGVNFSGEALWADPKGGSPVWVDKVYEVTRNGKKENVTVRVDGRIHQIDAVTLKTKNGIEIIKQTVVPTCAWDYTTAKAIEIQKLRDTPPAKYKAAKASWRYQVGDTEETRNPAKHEM